jgi:hypothetical protein
MFRCLTVLLVTVLAHTGLALGPHELLVLANRHSTNSLEIAQQYAVLRQIPDCNIVELDLPAEFGMEISPDAFTKHIWVPALKAVQARGLEDHILAWAYSVDVPIRIRADPPLSIQGITFLRNRLPAGELISKGLYASPLFAGPEHPRLPGFPAQSLDLPRAWLGKEMPLPSMMLGFMGPNGNTRDEILACLQRGAQADGTRPPGTVYFVTNSDIRSTCRTWQFEPAVRELQEQGVTAVITPALPGAATNILGATLGAADLTLGPELRFRPGAMAEHLTSFGALFESREQTKITAWIRAGATASAGTITEPYALWPKFPNARFQVHMASGCTIMESFFQSIRCPLQILLIGEPLAAPWSPVSMLDLRGLPGGPLRGTVTVEASVTARGGEVFNRFLFLLDGRIVQPLGKTPTLKLDTASLKPGPHRLRAVAYEVGSVRGQIFADRPLVVTTDAVTRP